MKSIKYAIFGVLSLVLLVASLIIFTEKVRPGHVGIVYNPIKGGIQDRVLQQGWNIVWNPLVEVTEYSIATEQVFLTSDSREGSPDDDSFNVATKDKSVKVSAQYSYKFDASNVAKLFTRFRGQEGDYINSNFIRGNLKTYISSVTSKYTLLEIYSTKRQEVNNEIFKFVKSQFAKDGIVIEEASIIDIEPDQQTKDSMAQQVALQSKIQQARLDNERAKIEAETTVINAKATADAQAISITQVAEAQAKANKLLSDSLTDKLVKIKMIEKWSGEMPQVQGGATPIVDLR